MPIRLTTPLEHNPGRGASLESYAEAKIVGFEAIVEPAADSSTTIRVQYGNTVDGEWVPGRLPVEYVVIADVAQLADTEGVIFREADPKYSAWVGSVHPTSTENLLYAEIAIALYSYLLTQEGFEGVIE
jgi:hypothetical protein